MNIVKTMTRKMVAFFVRENRVLTFMVVPHAGTSVKQIKLPVRALKQVAAGALIAVVASSVLFVHYSRTVVIAKQEQSELAVLRETHATQERELEELYKMAATIQQDIQKVNNLDGEVRRKLGLEQTAAVSRSGSGRSYAATVPGQGGPSAKPSTQELKNNLQQMHEDISISEQSLTYLTQAIEQKQALEAITPSIWPAQGQVTSRFGYRSSPWGGGSDYHPGIDIAADTGTPIVATADGVVVSSGWFSGYGKFIEIKHGNGISTAYGHNSQNIVYAGQSVKKGQVIAYMGSTGNSTGPHVHYEVRVNGSAINPARYM